MEQENIAIPDSEWPPDYHEFALDDEEGDGKSVFSLDGSSATIDLTDIAFVPSDHNADRYYHAIQATTLDSTIDEWENEFGYSRPLERVVERILTWKQNGSGSRAAARHEQAVKAAFNRKNPVRLADYHDIGSEDLMEDEEPVLKHLSKLSEAYLERHYSTPISVYRGCKYYLSEIARDLFERPTDSEIRIDTSVLLNMTIDDDIAYHYSPLVVNLDIQPGDVFFAVDHLFWHRWIPEVHSKPTPDGERYADGELQIFGKKAESFEHSNLTVLGSKPLSELINALPDDDSLTDVPTAAEELGFEVKDHRAIAICVTELRRANKTLSAGEPRNRLHNWYSILTKDAQDETFKVFNSDREDDARYEEVSIEEIAIHIEKVTKEAPDEFPVDKQFSKKVKHEQ